MPDSKIREEILYQGRILNLARETHRMPDDREASFEVVQHPGGAAALPILPDGRLILIRQFRPPIDMGRAIETVRTGVCLSPGVYYH